MGLKKHDPGFAFSGQKVEPGEIDRYEIYDVIFPSHAGNVGTAAAGTADDAKAMVITNKYADYPRNLAGAVAGSADIGGAWVVNGYDQFGAPVTETITIGTTADGGTVSGTMVFAQVASGTFTFDSDSVGSGTPALQYDTTGTALKFGLPFKIAGTADVISIAWTNEFTQTTINGGTIGAYVGAGGEYGYNNWFRGTEDLAGTQTYHVVAKPSFINPSGKEMTNL